MKSISFFLFMLMYCIADASENKQIFIGKTGAEGKTTFILELIGDHLEERVQITENGEVYLKVDQIYALPHNADSLLSSFYNHTQTALGSSSQAISSLLTSTFEERDPEEYVKCSSCGFYYYARPGHRGCPRCGAIN